MRTVHCGLWVQMYLRTPVLLSSGFGRSPLERVRFAMSSETARPELSQCGASWQTSRV
jgi:hypothetical protein